MRGHVDGETMAAFREGLLPARKAARIAAHLSSCPRCAEVDAQLAAVTAILASTPAPPMPASLAARLDAALAAEVAGRAGAGSPGHADPAAGAAPGRIDRAGAPAGSTTPLDGTAPGQGGPGHTGPGRRGGRSRAGSRLSLRLAAVTAAVVLLAGGGYAVARVISAGNSGVEASSSSASGSAASPGPEKGLAGSAPSARAAPGAAAEASLPVITSGTSYQPGQLKAQVGAVLKRNPVPTKEPPLSSGTGPRAAFPGLAACVSHLSGGREPKLIDIATYDGRPAAVIVVPVAGTQTVHVWVAGPGCSAQGGDVIAQTSLPAPG